MTKDRTSAFKAAAEEFGSYDESDGEVRINMENERGFMDAFFQEVQDLTAKIDFTEQKVKLIDKKQSDLLTDPSLDEKLKKEIEEIMAEVKSLIDGIRKRLNTMDYNIEIDEKKDGVTAGSRIRRIQHSSLTHKFMEIMVGYNSIQVEHREKCKQRIMRQLEITGRNLTDEEVEDMLETGNAAIFTQSINTEEKVAKQMLSDIKARHADIMKLEKSIRDLHEMFVDMAVMVEEQGKLVDQIEYQVHNTVEYVENAKETTKKAIKFQQSARKKKIIIILIVVAVILIIILIIALSSALSWS